MGSVTTLPIALRRASARPPRPAPVLPATGGRRGEYAVGDLARELKIAHHSVRVVIEKLRALAKHDGMPLPVTPRIERGQPIHGPRAIYGKSRWDAGQIDAWLDGRGPAAPAAPVALPIRQEMARRATQLVAVA